MPFQTDNIFLAALQSVRDRFHERHHCNPQFIRANLRFKAGLAHDAAKHIVGIGSLVGGSLGQELQWIEEQSKSHDPLKIRDMVITFPKHLDVLEYPVVFTQSPT